MSRSIAKYFWDLNKKALRETKKVIRDSQHPKFAMRMVSLLSRCQQPQEFFSIVPKKEFIKGWPKVKSYWKKVAQSSDFRDWWQTVYEQMLKESSAKQKRAPVKSSNTSLRIGKVIKEARIKHGFSQQELALRLGMKQPDISNIEKGKKNVTLETLTLVCRALEIKTIEL